MKNFLDSTWGWPILLALSSSLGLAAGILGDGVWDWACWIGLGAPVAVVAYKLLRQTGRTAS